MKINIHGIDVENQKEIANYFNEFLTNIGPLLDYKYTQTNTNPISFIPNRIQINMYLTPCTTEEIEKIIDKLKNCSPGWDELTSPLLKNCKKNLIGPLAHIINLSLSQGN